MKTDGDKSTMIAYKSLLCFYVSCKSILKVSPSLSPQLRFLLPFITVISTFLGAFFGRRGLSVNKAVDDKRREKKTSQEERHIYGWTSRFLSQNPAFSARKVPSKWHLKKFIQAQLPLSRSNPPLKTHGWTKNVSKSWQNDYLAWHFYLQYKILDRK